MCLQKKKKDNYTRFGRSKRVIRKTRKEINKESVITEHEVLNIVAMNVNSCHSEDRENMVKLGINTSKSDIIVLYETKLGPESNPVNVSGYKVVAQQDRKLGAGGIIVLCKDKIKVKEASAQTIDDGEDEKKEIQVTKFKIDDLMVIGVYRSPAATTPKSHAKLIEYLESAVEEHGSLPHVIVGDFNLPQLSKYDLIWRVASTLGTIDFT